MDMSEHITFWYGCNVLRHGDILHACLDILRALGYEPAPVYMCASFAAIPQALEDIHNHTVRSAKAAGADAVVTIFHQCYRELVGLDAAGAIPVYNYIQLIARAMGLVYQDEYKAWKRA